MNFQQALLVLELTSGKVLNEIEGLSENQDFLFPSSPVIQNKTLFYATRDGRVRAISLVDHREVWSRQLPERITSDLAFTTASILVATEGKQIYELDQQTGTTLRAFPTNGVARWKLIPSSGLLLFLEWKDTIGSGLKCIALATGQEIWNQQAPPESEWDTFRPLLWKNLIIVGSDRGYVAAFDSATGKPVWSLDIACGVRMLGASEYLFYAGCSNGSFHAILLPD
jgi:outer membrane protein assembly factor BamB